MYEFFFTSVECLRTQLLVCQGRRKQSLLGVPRKSRMLGMLVSWRARAWALLNQAKHSLSKNHHCLLRTSWWEKSLELIPKLLTSQTSWRMMRNRMTRWNPSSKVLQQWSSPRSLSSTFGTLGWMLLLSKFMAEQLVSTSYTQESTLWKLMGRLDCVDLGHDFFLIRFSLKEDFEIVLRKGPWFVGEHYLSIRPWEPNFKPSSANVSLVAVWVRLYELPIKYYYVEASHQIGKTIDNVLRMNTHTATEARGKFARLCV